MAPSPRELKYNQIKDLIQQEIIDRKLEAGEQILSITEIMERFQVSKVTAVRSVMELENEGIVVRERGRGTFVAPPKPGAANIRKSVAVIVPDMTNPYYAEVVSSLERRLRESNITIELSSTDYRVEEEQRHIELILHEQQVSGIVLFSLTTTNELNEKLLELPFVVIDHPPESLLGRCHIVASDNLQGGFLGTNHLIELGHKRIGFISFPGASQDRFKGYLRALRLKGIQPDDGFLLMIDTPYQKFDEELLDFIRSNNLTALFTFNDLMAAQCLQILRRAGYQIPGDISIVGYDNIHSAALFEVPLTTIEQYEEEMGRKAGDLLIELMQANGSNPPRPREWVLLPRLVVRESTGPATDSTENGQ